uniref:Amine oxidase domain-containing protein n=1 Tax=Rhizochromulina marina TaxID=1034831 RepID=A0A7S2R9P3_9STRA
MAMRAGLVWCWLLAVPVRPFAPRRVVKSRYLHLSSLGSGEAFDVVVVGAGIGGLSSAARLAAQGQRVCIVEKNSLDLAGGRAGSFEIQGRGGDGSYRFDRGPSLLLLPDVYEAAFKEAGGGDLWASHVEPRVTPVAAPLYTMFLDRAPGLPLSPMVLRGGEQGLSHDKAQFEALEVGGGAKYEAHIRQSQRILDGGLPNFISGQLRLPALLQMAQEALFGGAFPLESQDSQICRRFSSTLARAALTFQSLYVGLTPFEAPSVFNLLQPLELGPVPDPHRAEQDPCRQGIFYPVGGFGEVSRSLVRLAQDAGVQFYWDSPVDQVVVDETGRATGVRLTTGDVVDAAAVLVNVDLPMAEATLLPKSQKRDFSTSQFSCSVVSFHWALNTTLKPLSHHTLFLEAQSEARRQQSWEWESAFSSRGEGPANFYVHAPARTDPSACPEGHDAITVLVPAPGLRPSSEEAYDTGVVVSRARAFVLEQFRRAGMDVEKHLVAEQVVSAPKWKQDFGLERGSVFGLSHPLSQLSFFRPGPRSPGVRGLYYCGASARPGNGVPLVLLGAKQTVSAITADAPWES